MTPEEKALAMLKNRVYVIYTLELMALGEEGIGTYASPVGKQYVPILKPVLERALDGQMPSTDELHAKSGQMGTSSAAMYCTVS
jgi:hypothetical protein